jgi:hypothetical protein
MDRKSGPM